MKTETLKVPPHPNPPPQGWGFMVGASQGRTG
jgi:hypothetical protein